MGVLSLRSLSDRFIGYNKVKQKPSLLKLGKSCRAWNSRCAGKRSSRERSAFLPLGGGIFSISSRMSFARGAFDVELLALAQPRCRHLHSQWLHYAMLWRSPQPHIRRRKRRVIRASLVAQEGRSWWQLAMPRPGDLTRR